MRIGIPRETKSLERRVALTPAAVHALTSAGHTVRVESGAGAGVGFADAQYREAGAGIAADAAALFAFAELVVKVKEPQAAEYPLLRADQVLFAYLHLAADADLAHALCASGTTAVAFETVTADNGALPLLEPMSAIAGRVAAQAGATCLQTDVGGAGVLLGGIADVPPAQVTVVGGGVAGSHAIDVALGMGARVCALDTSERQLARLAERFGSSLRTLGSTPERVAELARESDLLIGAALVPGGRAPVVLHEEGVGEMRPGSVLVDIAIDQGGCFATSRPTTLEQPVFVHRDVVHYCVTNIPSAVARTATLALSQRILPFVLAIADQGWERASGADPHLANGLNVERGEIRHAEARRALERTATND